MEEKKRAAGAAPNNDTTKIEKLTDLSKILDYFRYTTGTTLDAMCDTGILRNSITFYVRDLENLGLLQAVFSAPDKRTKRIAKYYSADPAKWLKKPENRQLNLFGKEVEYGL